MKFAGGDKLREIPQKAVHEIKKNDTNKRILRGRGCTSLPLLIKGTPAEYL